MKALSVTAIANLIEAHIENDEQKFLAYASFIADAFDDAGEERSARIIRARIDGSYKNHAPVVLN